MLRDRIRQGAEAGMVATMQSGALVSDQLVNEMVKERLTEADAAKGFILDGYPRTIDQAEHLAAWLVGRGIHEVVIAGKARLLGQFPGTRIVAQAVSEVKR